MSVTTQQGGDRKQELGSGRRPDPQPAPLDQQELPPLGLQPVPGLHGALPGLRRRLVPADPLGLMAVGGSINEALRRRDGGGRRLSDSEAEPAEGQQLGIDTSALRRHAGSEFGSIAGSAQAGVFTSRAGVHGAVGEETDWPTARVAASRLATLVQAKLEVGPAGDAYEQEADRIANSVVDVLRRGRAADGRTDARADGQDDEPAVVRQASPVLSAQVSRRATPGPIGAEGGVMDTGLEASLHAASSGGAALAEPTRRQMEGAIGSDFSAVRVHTGPPAATLNDTISAEAFTTGNNIFFRDGLPDTGTAAGQSLLAHELVHTLQQSGNARRSVQAVQRRGDKKTRAPLDVIQDWEKYSAVSGKKRSSELKAIDNAVKTWVKGGRTAPGALDLNINQIQAIFDAIIVWKNSKTGQSVRDAAVADLRRALVPVAENAVARRTKQIDDQQVAAPLYQKFKSIDANTAQFAGKNVTDVKVERFEPDNQTAGLMAHTKKNDDGTLTDEALDELDADQIEDAKKLIETARGASIVVDPSIDEAQLREVMDSSKNALTGRTQIPELANISDANAEPEGEVTETIPGTVINVTYDKSDVHAAERVAALTAAIDLIHETPVGLPPLDVYFPKYGRKITVNSDCTTQVGAKIADAVFHPPAFLAVSSANTGNPKTDEVGPGQLKFLSAALGADDALIHTIIHEIGHAVHYHNDRGRFYNLNFAFFKGNAEDGRSYQQIAQTEVSGYGSNPREMVAEVFVGAVTGKKQFSDTIWEMYLAFGGADPR